jgi:hypothetical protein
VYLFRPQVAKRNQNISIPIFIVQSPSGDELDAASTHEQVHHISSEVIPDEEAFGSFTRREINGVAFALEFHPSD